MNLRNNKSNSEVQLKNIELITLDRLEEKIKVGELLTVVVVKAANVAKDILSNLENLKGGTMVHYEKLIDNAVDRALEKLRKKASEKGYDGVIGLKISNPMVVTGGTEVIVYGNGFKYIRQPESANNNE